LTIIVMTDLDGSLLSHSTLSFKQIHSDILDLLDSGIHIVPASSKTKIEMDVFCSELGRDLPFIYENGAGFENIGSLLPDSKLPDSVVSNAAVDVDELWRIWGEHVPNEIKKQCLFVHEMDVKQQIDLLGLKGQKLENALMRGFSFCFKFVGSRVQLRHLKHILDKNNLTFHQGGRVLTLCGKHDKSDYCDFIQSNLSESKFVSFLVGVGDSENDVALLEACDVACIIPRPHKPLLSLSIPLDRTIIAGSIAPLGWLEAVRKALAINNTEKVANYG